MIVIKKRNNNNEFEPVLAYDGEEMWGYPEIWESSVDLVGLSEKEFARWFEGPNLLAFDEDEDPFEDVPGAEEMCRNYPPGSEDIPDVETRGKRSEMYPEDYDDENACDKTNKPSNGGVQSVKIRDFETDDLLGTLHPDGRLDADDEYLREIYEGILEEGEEYGAPFMDGYYDPEEDVHHDGFVNIKPGEKGFLLAVRESMPSPYDVAPDKWRDLKTPDKRLDRPDHIED